MYIKQVVIHGFKSYRDHNPVDEFDPGHNVVVGRNGSGKSNFLFAIQFILSNEFSHLRPDQRRELLHVSSGTPVTSAFVEIVFDNTDRRLAIAKDEVALRRIIGVKTDNFFLNKKIFLQADVTTLLESAGFSNTNHYYIVKQGEINQMAIAPDAQRLKLLREIAGTMVYEEKVEETNYILRQIEIRAANVVKCLEKIEERLRNLEEEKEELKEYQQWEKQRRCLQYTIYNQGLANTKKQLNELRKSLSNGDYEQDELKVEMKTANAEYIAAAERLKEVTRELQAARKDRKTIQAERETLVDEKIRLIITIKDSIADPDGTKENEDVQKKLKKLESTITEKEKKLDKTKSKFEEVLKETDNLTRELALREQTRKELFAKQSRDKQFSSRAARDEWIKNELIILNKQIDAKEKYHAVIENEIKRHKERQTDWKINIKKQEVATKKEQKSIDAYKKQYEELNKNKEKEQASRNKLYAEENSLMLELSILKEKLAKVDRALKSIVSAQMLNGEDSVREVLEIFAARGEELEGYCGQVIDIFGYDENILTAIEVTSENRLFHHIVETHTLGTKILNEMKKLHLPGEVTFISLNRLKNKKPCVATTGDALTMISCLYYNDKYDKVVKFIFGKTLLCRNLTVSTRIAREFGLDCATIEGDQVSAKGSLTTGYFDRRISHIEVHKRRTELANRIFTLEEKLEALKNAITTAKDKIISYVSEMQSIENLESKAVNNYAKMAPDFHLMEKELEAIQSCLTAKERRRDQSIVDLEAMKVTKERLKKELDEDLTCRLSPGEQQQLDTLREEIKELRATSKTNFAQRMDCEKRKDQLEAELTSKLKRIREQLIETLQKVSPENRQRQLDSCRTRLTEFEERLVIIDDRYECLTVKIEQALEQEKLKLTEVEKSKMHEKDVQERIEANMRDSEMLKSRQNMLHDQLDDDTKKIAALGILPNPAAYEKFANMSTKNLLKEIEKLNKRLKKYSRVNRLALEQYVSISGARDQFIICKEVFDRGYAKIKEVMSVLKQKNYKAIQFTFRKMSKYFSDIFKKLVPSGCGKLFIKSANGDMSNNAEPETGEYDELTGIGIQVSFGDQTSKMQEMSKLSSGQKSLVALTLIFAIQKCNPAPFYLFDEIDQALDAEHRTAVADVIRELSSEAQFVTTTFSPELLQHAAQFYRVTNLGAVSHVECVTRQQAIDFVTDHEP